MQTQYLLVSVFKKKKPHQKKKSPSYTPAVLENNLIHMEPHMQAVRQCQALTKARGGDMTSKWKNMLANEKREEHQKWHIPRNGSSMGRGGGGESSV